MVDDKEKLKEIGKQIKDELKKKNFSVVQFANAISKSENWCFMLFRGKVLPQYLDQLKIESLLKIQIWNL